MAYQPFLPDCQTAHTSCRSSTTQDSIKTSILLPIELVQNDTGPQLLLLLVDSESGLPIDLSRPGVECEFHLYDSKSSMLKASIPMFPGPSAANGEVMLDWKAYTVGALDTVGSYLGEVQINWPEGRVQTAPIKLKLSVRKELA